MTNKTKNDHYVDNFQKSHISKVPLGESMVTHFVKSKAWLFHSG